MATDLRTDRQKEISRMPVKERSKLQTPWNPEGAHGNAIGVDYDAQYKKAWLKQNPGAWMDPETKFWSTTPKPAAPAPAAPVAPIANPPLSAPNRPARPPGRNRFDVTPYPGTSPIVPRPTQAAMPAAPAVPAANKPIATSPWGKDKAGWNRAAPGNYGIGGAASAAFPKSAGIQPGPKSSEAPAQVEAQPGWGKF